MKNKKNVKLTPLRPIKSASLPLHSAPTMAPTDNIEPNSEYCMVVDSARRLSCSANMHSLVEKPKRFQHNSIFLLCQNHDSVHKQLL